MEVLMKHRMPICSFLAALLLSSVFAVSARAQTPQVEAQVQNILATHPEAGMNPSLLNDPGWLKQHPDVDRFMADHPNVRRQVASGDFGGWGAYDENHGWHPATWWHQNHPDWVYANHPEWADRNGWAETDYRAHPEWFKHDYWKSHHHSWMH
jgi:hypothetical protein